MAILQKKMMRMNDLINAYENLGEVPALPPQRRHKLTNYSSAHTIKGFDYFSIIIDVNYRIVFHAIPPEIPLGEHGEMLLGQIKEIKIIEIVDYHD